MGFSLTIPFSHLACARCQLPLHGRQDISSFLASPLGEMATRDGTRGKRAIFLCNEASAKWSVCDRVMATRDQTRDGTAVTKRCEVAPKTRIVCGEISIKRKGFHRRFVKGDFNFLLSFGKNSAVVYDQLCFSFFDTKSILVFP